MLSSESAGKLLLSEKIAQPYFSLRSKNCIASFVGSKNSERKGGVLKRQDQKPLIAKVKNG
jgi:hypothetical protein